MVLAMSRPWKHPKSGIYWLRKRVPTNLRLMLGKTEARRSLRTRDLNEAKVRNAEGLIALEVEWAATRAAKSTRAAEANDADALQPRELSEREAHERARWLYSHWLWKHRDYPSKQTFWRTDLFRHLWAKVDVSQPAPVNGISVVDLVQISKMKHKCFDEADTLAVVHDWVLDEASRTRLAKALGDSLQLASLSLSRQASGEENQPSIQSQKKVAFDDLISGWAIEKRPAPKTVYEWRRALDQFAGFLGHRDAARVTPDNVVGWKETLVAEGRRLKTIRDAKIVPVRTIFQWGVDSRRLTSNPARGLKIEVRRRPGEGPRGFADEEARLILVSAEQETNPILRWVPIVCAYTGARISEVCQLRTKDIALVDGVWAITFNPDAGSVKTEGSERTIPIHPALLASGFPDFVRSSQEGVLFPSLPPDKFGKRGGNGTKVVGRWVRSLGIDDPRIQPNHSWRHRLRTSARRYGLAPDLVGAITGHESQYTGDRYGENLMEAMLRELSKIPSMGHAVQLSGMTEIAAPPSPAAGSSA